MVNKGVLAKNYYIVPEAVADYGTNIYNMMAETDQALEEASGIIGEISSLAERVPSQARCGTLLEACASAQAEVRSVDFLSYGQRVKQGLQNLLDHNQYITNNFIKTMGTYTEKMHGFGMECRRLADLITYTTEYKEQINIIQSMTEVMRSMNGGNSIISVMEITEKPYPNDVIYSDSEDTDSPVGFMDFIVGRTGDMDRHASMAELKDYYESGLITDEQYKYFQGIVNMVSYNRVPSSVVEALRVQAFNSFYKEEIATLERYVNEQVLRDLEWQMEAATEKYGENFVEELRMGMLDGGIVNEISITSFLATITMESDYGRANLEERDDYTKVPYTSNTRGVGFIQLTGETLYAYVDYLKDHTDGEERELLQEYLDDFVESDEGVWDNTYTEDEDHKDGVPISEYIAENYSIQSTIWFWSNCEKFMIDGQMLSINECLEQHGEEIDGDIMFLAVQCAVNVSEFDERGRGRFFNPNNDVSYNDNTIVLEFSDITGDMVGHRAYYDNYIGTDADGYRMYRFTSFTPKAWPKRLNIYETVINYFGED